jgi:hypothetical protein
MAAKTVGSSLLLHQRQRDTGMRYFSLFSAALFALLAIAPPAIAVLVGDVYKGSFPNQFFDGPVTITAGTFDNNSVRVFTYYDNTADPDGGGGFVIAVSNGENGIDVGAGAGPGGVGINTDIPNPTPVGAAIDIVNGGDGTMGNRIQNGNAFRFSVWIQQDPDHPITAEPSVEPELKFELWSEAQSTFADYDGRKPFANQGDRLWDTDLNARDPYYDGYGQSVSSPIDINDNGTVVTGDTPVVSIPQATGVQWVRVETTIVIDDDPDESGLGWDIAAQDFHVDAIEEVRATFFTGDFSGDSSFLANGGKFFVDNALLEVFPDEATMLATSNPNPMPTAALIGDYNDDGTVDGADYTVWRDNLNMSAAALANRDPNISGLVKESDFLSWRNHYGESNGGGAGASVSVLAYAPAAVPEPSSLTLLVMAGATLLMARMRR